VALIPDEAIWCADEIPAGAFRMYTYFCLRRDHNTGICFPSLGATAADLDMGYTYASTMRKALLEAKWIALENGQIRPLKGFDNSGNAEGMFRKPETKVPQKRKPVSKTRKESSAKPEHLIPPEFRKNGRGVPQKRNIVSAKPELPYIEPAQLTSRTNQVEPAEKPPSPVVEVFDYWKTKLNHSTARCSEDRKRLINGRLKEGYSVADLKRAIDGCAASEWHRGKNDRNRAFDGLDLILRNGSHVDKFIALVPATNGNGTAPPKNCPDCHGDGVYEVTRSGITGNVKCSHRRLNGNGATHA